MLYSSALDGPALSVTAYISQNVLEARAHSIWREVSEDIPNIPDMRIIEATSFGERSFPAETPTYCTCLRRGTKTRGATRSDAVAYRNFTVL